MLNGFERGDVVAKEQLVGLFAVIEQVQELVEVEGAKGLGDHKVIAARAVLVVLEVVQVALLPQLQAEQQRRKGLK